MHAITFHHVRRKANSLADFLSNLGVNSPHSLVEGMLHDYLDDQIRTECLQFDSSDLSLPDAGDNNDDTRPILWPPTQAHVMLDISHHANAVSQPTQDSLCMGEISPVTSAHANWAGEGTSS